MSYLPPQPTERQRVVLSLLSWGYTDTMVADELNIERSTVKSHMERLYDKMGVHTRTAAVAMAIRNGWIE